MTDAVGALGNERSSYHGPQSRQRSIAAADQKGGLVRPILRRVAAAMKPIETTAREAN
jgi:hypothetical protein